MAKYRKKPVVVDAVRWMGNNIMEIEQFVGRKLIHSIPPPMMEREMAEHLPAEAWWLEIPTLEGNMKAICMDYIIKGVAGEFYPCKPDIFEKTYEPA